MRTRLPEGSRAMAQLHAPGPVRRLFEDLGAGAPHLLEGGVEVVGAEDGGLEGALQHEGEEGIPLGR